MSHEEHTPHPRRSTIRPSSISTSPETAGLPLPPTIRPLHVRIFISTGKYYSKMFFICKEKNLSFTSLKPEKGQKSFTFYKKDASIRLVNKIIFSQGRRL
jgi:hypothetical protein